VNAEGEISRRALAVWIAARDADAQYADRAAGASRMTRAEYVGRAVLVALQANVGGAGR
jgi:hypothetical protein